MGTCGGLQGRTGDGGVVRGHRAGVGLRGAAGRRRGDRIGRHAGFSLEKTNMHIQKPLWSATIRRLGVH